MREKEKERGKMKEVESKEDRTGAECVKRLKKR